MSQPEHRIRVLEPAPSGELWALLLLDDLLREERQGRIRVQRHHRTGTIKLARRIRGSSSSPASARIPIAQGNQTIRRSWLDPLARQHRGYWEHKTYLST